MSLLLDDDDEWDAWDDSAQDNQIDEMNESRPSPRSSSDNARRGDTELHAVIKQLKAFQMNLADSSVIGKCNRELMVAAEFDNFIRYYRSKNRRSDLAVLTIQKELSRMPYTVTYKGEVFTTEEQIVKEVYPMTQEEEIWSLANQSIYGDILQVLQTFFLDPLLAITISNSGSEFHINLDSKIVSSRTKFSLGCNREIELATLQADITVNLSTNNCLQHLSSPELPFIFDEDIRSAAMSVVEMNRIYQPQGDRGGNSGKKGSLLDIDTAREKLLQGSNFLLDAAVLTGNFITGEDLSENSMVESLRGLADKYLGNGHRQIEGDENGDENDDENGEDDSRRKSNGGLFDTVGRIGRGLVFQVGHLLGADKDVHDNADEPLTLYRR